MIGTRIALALGITTAFALVQGSSTAAQSPPPGAEVEEETPQDEEPESSDPGATAGDNTPSAPAPEVPKEKSKKTFIVTSTGTGELGGNLGGLEGADKKCQDLATAVGAGDHTWHAYLSVEGTNAKDRIGAGPWQNQKGTVIAESVEALHDYQFIPSSEDLVDEKGAPVPADRSMILTGSKHDGTALPQTCQGWTSNANNQRGRVGDSASDTSVLLGVRWNDAVKSYACTQQAMNQNKGEGRLYCFAID